jgi:hypothetical protein
MLNNKLGWEKQGICTVYWGTERLTGGLDVSRGIQPSTNHFWKNRTINHFWKNSKIKLKFGEKSTPRPLTIIILHLSIFIIQHH